MLTRDKTIGTVLIVIGRASCVGFSSTCVFKDAENILIYRPNLTYKLTWCEMDGDSCVEIRSYVFVATID